MKDINYLKQHNVDVNQSLELFGDIETYNDTLKEFKNGLEGKVDQIAKYYKEEDMANYAIFVHSLKSDCKYFGFMKLAALAYDHELKSKANDLKWVKENYDELVKETNEVKKIVYEYLDEELATNEVYGDKPNVESITDDNIILVADDSEVVRVFVKKIFDDAYEIASARNGEEAIEIIKEHQNDNLIKAILLDLNMPKLSGFAVLDYMTENDLINKMPVTIISGDASSDAINKAFEYGIVDMISKPFNETKIKDAVMKIMNYNKES